MLHVFNEKMYIVSYISAHQWSVWKTKILWENQSFRLTWYVTCTHGTIFKAKTSILHKPICYVHEVGPTSLTRIFESILRICLSFIRLQITESYYTIFILQYLMLLFMLIYYWFVARSARIHIGTFKDIKINFWAWYYTLGYYTFTTFHI